MDVPDLLALAEEHYITTFLVAFCMGLFQGTMIARGIRNRFPSLRAHARIASTVLLVVFTINALFSIAQFSTIETIDLGGEQSAGSLEEIVKLAASVFGIDGGFWSIVAISITLALTLLFRLAELPGIVRYSVFTVSAIVLLAALAGRLGGYAPTDFHITTYALYHAGLVFGAYLVMRRGSKVVAKY